MPDRSSRPALERRPFAPSHPLASLRYLGREMTRISARELSGQEGPFGRGVEVRRPPEVPEGSVVTVLRVPPEVAGMRLDRFVQTQLKRTSRTRAARIVARGAYSPDARR